MNAGLRARSSHQAAVVASLLLAVLLSACQGDSGVDPLNVTTTTSTNVTTTVGSTSPTISSSSSSTNATSTTATTPTTTNPQPFVEGELFLWDTVWQIAAKADEAAMAEYVERLATARGSAGQSITGFWFSVVNINQDINTPNGSGHTFGSFGSPNSEYLRDVDRLIELANDSDLRVGIVVAWDGPNQFSVEQGKLTVDNAYAYGNTLADRWTDPEFAARDSVDAWIMGGDTTNDCCDGEHAAVWSEVVRGIQDAEQRNGFSPAQILFHTAPRQHLHYLGAMWLDGHAPQTGHCADASTATAWLAELFEADGRAAPVWGNGEMRYENIQWECNGFEAITAQQVLNDALAMAQLPFVENHVYGYDPRWNAERPGDVGMSAGGVSPGLQMILDEPGLIETRPPLPQ
ncbi:MAG: DUF4038 domain-containing protein [Acidimicrobiia bacterium]|nr:DUF4038 domain-containing protein [Acidimicrobiia bacterium]